MAIPENAAPEFGRPVRRLLLALVLAFLVAVVIFWRIDNPRAEHFRLFIIDQIVPKIEWVLVPVSRMSRIVEDFRSYVELYEQNQELRKELRQMKAWQETAIRLDQENARLKDLNNVQLDREFSYITSLVLVDSGGPFQQSVLINIGSDDGVKDGWAALDGLGLVGRVSGVGKETSRVILLTDSNSWIPVEIVPSNSRVFLAGDNSRTPPLVFADGQFDIRTGDRVITTGDGDVFPPGLPVGVVFLDASKQLRVKPAADLDRLEFLRIVRFSPSRPIPDSGELVVETLVQQEPASRRIDE